MIPKDITQRTKVLQWVHAAEGTFILHALAITYTRWTIPSGLEPDILAHMEKGLSVNVQKDLDWLESELSLSQGKFLCGETITAADTMMQFSVEFILATKLGTQGRDWPGLQKWLEACRGTEGYKRVVEKSGHKLTVVKSEGK